MANDSWYSKSFRCHFLSNRAICLLHLLMWSAVSILICAFCYQLPLPAADWACRYKPADGSIPIEMGQNCDRSRTTLRKTLRKRWKFIEFLEAFGHAGILLMCGIVSNIVWGVEIAIFLYYDRYTGYHNTIRTTACYQPLLTNELSWCMSQPAAPSAHT